MAPPGGVRIRGLEAKKADPGVCVAMVGLIWASVEIDPNREGNDVGWQNQQGQRNYPRGGTILGRRLRRRVICGTGGLRIEQGRQSVGRLEKAPTECTGLRGLCGSSRTMGAGVILLPLW